jgi:hypothetical protein
MSDAVQTARPKRPRLKLVAPVVPEDELHCAAAQMLDVAVAPPAMWTCFPAGNVPLPPEYAAKLARMGLHSGWPDILIVYRNIYGIELKRQGGVLSRTRTVRTRRGGLRVIEGQVDTFPKLVKAGMCIAVCRSIDEILAALRDWSIPLRISTDLPVRVGGGVA